MKLRRIRNPLGADEVLAPAQPEAVARHSLRRRRERDEPGTVERAPGRGFESPIDLSQYTQVPAWYVLEFDLGTNAGDTDGDAVGLRPEMFLLKRITWASAAGGLVRASQISETNQNPSVHTTFPPGLLPCCKIDTSDSIKVSWSDEFTKFMGNTPAILAALFGQQNGFLDLPNEVLFAGKQTLEATLERIYTLPGLSSSTQHEAVQIVFHGTGLLPRNVHQSGSL